MNRRGRVSAEGLRERVAVLENSLNSLSDQLDDTHKKVEEMHEVLLQARGAKWVIVGGASIIGFLSSIIANLIPWSHK